jgi:hypothetical protein
MDEIHKNSIYIALDSIVNTCNTCLHQLKSNSARPDELEHIVSQHIKVINDIIMCHRLIENDEYISVLKSIVDNFSKDIKILNSCSNTDIFNDYTYYKDNIHTIRTAASNIQRTRYNQIY